MGEYILGKNAPPHHFAPGATYIVTARTYKGLILFDDLKKRHFLDSLFVIAERLQWKLEAWVVLDNHYHIIATARSIGYQITKLVQPLHSITAKYINQIDQAKGRRGWQNYWDTRIDHEKSYVARMNYVLMNPVKHGLVNNPTDYPFSSFRWFIEKAEIALKDRVFATQIDKVDGPDYF